MAIVYESFGDFSTGAFSYRLLLSKKTLGTITLTDTSLLFESQVDKIVFEIKLSDIQDFFLRNRLTIPLIELITIHGTTYSIFPLIRKSKVFGSSLEMTEELFRHLARIIYNKNQVILFDAISVFYPGSLTDFNSKAPELRGHIFLTENYIMFRSFQQGKEFRIKIPEIKQIMMEAEGSTTYTTVETKEGKSYTLLILKAQRRRFLEDKFKTEKLYDVLNQVKMYKESEKPEFQKDDGVKNGMITCSSCGNSISRIVKHCPFCGSEI